MAKKLTIGWLASYGACPHSLDWFEEFFGSECFVTAENVARWVGSDPPNKDCRSRLDLWFLVAILIAGEDPTTHLCEVLPVGKQLAKHLGIEREGYWWMASMVSNLPKPRLCKAIVQIAEMSPNL